MMKNRIRILSLVIASILLFEAGCVSSNDPEKRKNRALAGGATITALGLATVVGGPILAARVALGAASRVATGEAMDKMKDKKGEQPVEGSGETISKTQKSST